MRRPATIAGLALVVCSLAFAQDAGVKVVGPHSQEDEAAIQKVVAGKMGSVMKSCVVGNQPGYRKDGVGHEIVRCWEPARPCQI